MKISDFYVSNFGIFTAAGGPLSKGLSVFYGENESGKTTLMNFFRRILFSREKRTRLKGNPYNPFNGSVPGGTVRIAMEDGREYQITLEGGKNLIASSEGGLPTELPPDFFSINRDVYESIFAMGLSDMQSLTPLNSSDVAARFFSAGAGLGSASLPRLLSTFEAREKELFNPGNGRTSSAVKKLLAAMDETDDRLKEVRRVNAGWREKKASLKEMEEACETKRRELGVLKTRLDALELLEKGRPSWNVLQDLFRRLRELEGIADFPENGLARLDSLNREAERLTAELGGPHIVVNNAGVTRDTLLMRMKDDEWRTVLETNLTGAFNVIRAVQRPMIKGRYGRIINISSIAGISGNAGQANYASAKAGLIGLTKSVAKELGSRGITCNAVAPGYIPTDLTASLPAELIAEAVRHTPMGRLGTVEDVAQAVAFLASDAASFITAQVLSVDGGMIF